MAILLETDLISCTNESQQEILNLNINNDWEASLVYDEVYKQVNNELIRIIPKRTK